MNMFCPDGGEDAEDILVLFYSRVLKNASNR